MFSDASRRVAAVVLPLLASEVARASCVTGGRPLAILIDLHPQSRGGESARDEGSRTIDAVDEAAHARGVRPGQRVSEAAALTACLLVVRVTAQAIEAALARVADVALGLGPLVAIGPPDTVWVDVTGAAHLWGGEEPLLAALEERVRALGHRARGAIAEGPRLARALARFAQRAGVARIAPPGRGADAIAMLPVRSLFGGAFSSDAEANGDEAVVALLVRLGVWKVADLARLPAAAAAPRLGDAAQEIIALAQGRDPTPLVPHRPPSRVTEEASLEDGVENAAALVFVARGLVSRAAARLSARGEATSRIDLELRLDRSIVLLRAAPSSDLALAIDLPAPLGHESDLLRAIKAKLEALVLPAPVVAVRLVLSRIAPAPEVQLAMGGPSAWTEGGGVRAVDPDALAALLSELSAEIGAARLGVLVVHDDHRPEARAALEPPCLDQPSARSASGASASTARAEKAARSAFGARACDFEVDLLPSPTRLLASRPALGTAGLRSIAPGAVVVVGRRRFVVEKVTFDRRVDGARWWTHAPAARDYLRVSLRAEVRETRASGPGQPSTACVEAWVYLDRHTGEAVLHGLWE